MGLADIGTNHRFYGDVMKRDVTEAEIETLVSERQFPQPVDFDEVHLRQMSEALAAPANHFARNIHSEDLLEVAGERLQESACSTANLQSTLMRLKNFRHAFQHELDIPLARGSEGSVVLGIITGDRLVSVVTGPRIPIAFHVEAAHGKVQSITGAPKKKLGVQG